MISKKNAVLLTLVSTTFLLTMVSYVMPQTQQAFAQGFFDQQQTESDVSDSEVASTGNTTISTTTPTESTEASGQQTTDQKLILGDITIPIDADTTLSLEMPDSKITVTPNK